MITLIAALDRNLAIGKAGTLPWHLPDDLKRFKKLTSGKPILMGRKTAQSIGRPLPDRRNFVLSWSNLVPLGFEQVHSIKAALDLCQDNELMVIGGGEIYREVYETVGELVNRLHLTWVDTETAGADAFFPFQIYTRSPSSWKEVTREHHAIDARHAYAFDFVDYEKIDS